MSTLACNLSNDSRKFWRNFIHLSARQKIQGGALDVDVESINQHFLSIAHKTTGDLQFSSTSYISVLDVPVMALAEVDVSEVYRHICGLGIHKAVGVDNISTKFIKASPGGVSVLLTRLINKSITSHTFPDIWKNAVVVPVFLKVQSEFLII